MKKSIASKHTSGTEIQKHCWLAPNIARRLRRLNHVVLLDFDLHRSTRHIRRKQCAGSGGGGAGANCRSASSRVITCSTPDAGRQFKPVRESIRPLGVCCFAILQRTGNNRTAALLAASTWRHRFRRKFPPPATLRACKPNRIGSNISHGDFVSRVDLIAGKKSGSPVQPRSMARGHNDAAKSNFRLVSVNCYPRWRERPQALFSAVASVFCSTDSNR